MERLLERDDELAALVEAVDSATEGRGAFVLVGGEAGSGKTSLIRALRDRLGPGVFTVVGACEPLLVPVPRLAIGRGAQRKDRILLLLSRG